MLESCPYQVMKGYLTPRVYLCTSSGCNRGCFRMNDAAVLTPAIAGAASPVVFAGAAAPADLPGTGVPAVAGMEFLAVAEDLSLADYAGGCP